MEKLQAAIEKARQQRSASTASPRTSVKAGGAPQSWEGFEPMDMRPSHLRKHRVFIDGQSREASHFDVLRTKVMQQCKEHGWKRVLVTSPSKGCGKTTICANLAASFSRQNDRRLVLLDLDMRRPELARVFGHRGQHNVADVFQDKLAFREQAVALSSNVLVAMNQAPVPNPSKLILQDRFAAKLDEIEAELAPDLMLLDSPPLGASDDTLALLKLVDAVLIAVAAEKTTTAQLDACEKEIAEHANVMGVVLNMCLHTEESYGYDYAY